MTQPPPRDVEQALAKVRVLIRRPPADRTGPPATTRLLPLEMTDGEPQYLDLLADEVEAIEAAKAALLADLQFEHLGDADDKMWRFIADCWINRKTDQVPMFIEWHRQKPMDLVCYLPIEYLTVDNETAVFDIRLLPLSDTRIPPADTWFRLEYPVACVAAVEVRGTDHERMVERARAQAAHALRLLRVTLREHPSIHNWQLRFRLGITYAFDEPITGWKLRDDSAYDLTLGGELIELVRNQPVARLPAEPSTDIEKKADLAVRWMERAWLTGEPLVALLYLFFALESLLGDKSEGLKAHGLAFRQTMLSHIVIGGFSHPNKTWFLYDQVRSGAVHGEDAPEVSWDTVHNFAWVVRRALNQYLTVATERQLAKRGRLLKVLDEHPNRPQVIDWLRANGGPVWTPYLDKIENK